MEKVRDIIKLFVEGYSYRQISKITGVHRTIITSYMNHLSNAPIRPQEALLLTQDKLFSLYKKEEDKVLLNEKHLALNSFLDYVRQELAKKHVTRQLLYKEYKEKYSDAFSYSHFCLLLSNTTANKDYSLFQIFNPGEIMMTDFAGDKLSCFDKQTGEKIDCEVLITTLGYSGYTFVIALADQSQESFIEGLNNALVYFQGSPTILRFDNLKSGVIKSDRYEPTFNALMIMFCEYYGIVPDATRVRKPKDKAQVESHVNIVYQRIYAPLRNHTFFSINEVNHAIKLLLTDHNQRPFRGGSKSRKDYYLEEHKLMTSLPEQTFRRKYSKKAIVQKNYHIWLGHDEHYYSVHYQYAGKEVTLTYDYDIVEIYHDYSRIALHPRKHKIGRYSTIKEHMPQSHIAVKDGINPEWLKKQASFIGPNVAEFIEKLLNKGLLTPQHFKSCQGILALSKKYPKDRLENACKRGLLYNNYTYKSIVTILEKNLDFIDQEVIQTSIFNPDTRGNQSFN